MREFLVWASAPAGNACMLESIENFGKPRDLLRGASFSATFPSNVSFRMSTSLPKSTALADDLMNMASLKVCSQRLMEFLKAEGVAGVEYLPVTILDHRGNAASRDYFVVHALGLQDAVDEAASQPTHNPINPRQIDYVKQLVVDDSKVDSAVSIFRLAKFNYHTLIERGLADRMKGAGFVGPAFRELSTVNG